MERRDADKSLARPGRKQATATEDFDVHIFIIIIGGILVLFIHITRLASKEIFSLPCKIHREVGRAKDLSAPRYQYTFLITSRSSVLRMRNVSDKSCRGYENTYLKFNKFFSPLENRTLGEIMWKNMLGSNGPHVTM